MIAAQISGEWAYVGVAWGVTAVVIGGYALSIVRKGRRLSARVPKESRRWM